MRILSIATVGALALGFALGGTVSASGQAGAAHRKIYGYQDAETGVFHPMLKATPDVTAAPITGEIEVTFTITLKTAVPTGGSVICSTQVDAVSENTSTGASSTYSEGAATLAKVSGTTATCTVNTPYSWAFPAASATVLNEVSGGYTVSIVPSTNTGTILTGLDDRSSASSFLPLTKLPATGTTSKYAVNATL